MYTPVTTTTKPQPYNSIPILNLLQFHLHHIKKNNGTSHDRLINITLQHRLTHISLLSLPSCSIEKQSDMHFPRSTVSDCILLLLIGSLVGSFWFDSSLLYTIFAEIVWVCVGLFVGHAGCFLIPVAFPESRGNCVTRCSSFNKHLISMLKWYNYAVVPIALLCGLINGIVASRSLTNGNTLDTRFPYMIAVNAGLFSCSAFISWVSRMWLSTNQVRKNNKSN